MRQDKDRGGKWLLAHHGDAILRLGGITGFTSWQTVQPETVAPRRLPDGVLEVRFPDDPNPVLVLVEVETYPDADVDRQVLDDLMLIALDRKVVPEVVSLVLKPKGNLTVAGRAEQVSPRGRTRLGGSWPVVRLWEVDAEALFAAGDPGLIPWVPLTRTSDEPDALVERCRDRLQAVPDQTERMALSVVTEILAGLAFSGRRFPELFRGLNVGIEAPFQEGLRLQAEALGRQEGRQAAIVDTLGVRFGTVPEDLTAALSTVTDERRLVALNKLAVTCADLAAFAAALRPAQP